MMADKDSLWIHAHVTTIRVEWKLQWVVGATPSTVFARMVASCQDQKEKDKADNAHGGGSSAPCLHDVLHVLWNDLRQQQQDQQKQSMSILLSSFPTPLEWLRLGAVWHVPDASTTTTTRRRRKATRLCETQADSMPLQSPRDTLRVHVRPSRFPAVLSVDWNMRNRMTTANKRTAMVHHQHSQDLGFVIVNKPCGVPSHATVDNCRENVLYQLQQQPSLASTKANNNHNHCSYSLPQRLDIDTSGLLLVATRSEMTSYMGKLIEQKSTTSTAKMSHTHIHTTTTTAIHKEYRCLLHVHRLEQCEEFQNDIDKSHGMVLHYMDAHSTAPKTFVSLHEYQRQHHQQHQETNQKETDKAKHQPQRWRKCVLRVFDVGACQQLLVPSSSSSNNNDHSETLVVLPVRIELLTGRTHQIRGQFAAMGLPLVGDSLYNPHQYRMDTAGNHHHSCDWDALRHRQPSSTESSMAPAIPTRLALQCCFLSFPRPQWTSQRTGDGDQDTNHEKIKANNNKKSKRRMIPMLIASQEELCTFQLESAWWTDQLRPLHQI